MNKKTITEQAEDFLKKIIAILPEKDEFKEGYEKMLSGIQNAKPMADNEEKQKRLECDAINAANHAAFAAFRKNLLTNELEVEYRSLPTSDYVAGVYTRVLKERQEKDKELQQKVVEAQNAEKEMEVFAQVIGGRSREEAEQAYDNYVKAAAGGMR